MINFLKYNKEYEKNLSSYTKKDGWLAILLFIIFVSLYAILGKLNIEYEFVKDNILLIGCIFNFIIILITIMFVKLNKQTLDTIGLYKGKLKQSIIVGIVIGTIFFINNCGIYLLKGSSLINLKEIGIFIIYFLLVSVCEELVFRGYINTRIQGVIKSKVISIIFVGLLFIVMHFPYRMIAYRMTLQNLTIDNFSWIVDLFITHVIFSFIYFKTNSIYGTIIPHWISNFAYSIVNK